MRRAAIIAVAVGCAACGGTRRPPAHGGTESARLIVVAPAGDPAELDPGVPGTSVVVAPEPEATAAARAAPALERARTLYRDLAFEESLAVVGEAQIVLERDPRAPEDFAALHRALVHRAMNELALGREARADEALRHAVSIAPQATLDEGLYPPDVRARYDAVRASARAEPPVPMAITTEPPGASVRIDGNDAGATPITVHALPGRHYVGLSAPGHAQRVVPVELDANPAPLHVTLPRATFDDAVAQIAAEDPERIAAASPDQRRALAEVLHAARIAWVTEEGPERWSGTRIDLDTGRAHALAPRGGTLERAIETMVADSRSPEEPDAPEGEEGSILETPWPWIAAAAVVAGGAIGLYFLLRDPGHEVVVQ